MKFTTHEGMSFSDVEEFGLGLRYEITGRLRTYGNSSVHGDIQVSYYTKGRKHSLLELRWQPDYEITIEHSSGYYNTPEEADAFISAFNHAKRFMKIWREDGRTMDSAFRALWDTAPWEPKSEDDPYAAKIGKQAWTEVECQEWKDYAARLQREVEQAKAEALWLEIDPSGTIQPLVEAAVKRCKSVSTLRRTSTRFDRHELNSIVRGSNIENCKFNREVREWTEEGSVRRAPTLAEKQKRILSAIMNVLGNSRTKGDKDIYTKAQAIYLAIHEREGKAEELAAAEKRLAMAEGKI